MINNYTPAHNNSNPKKRKIKLKESNYEIESVEKDPLTIYKLFNLAHRTEEFKNLLI